MVVNPSPRCAHRLSWAAHRGSVRGDCWSSWMKDESAPPRPRRSRLVVGIGLLVLGGMMLAVNLGYGLPSGWWQYFPVLFMALGLWGLILPNRHLSRSGGVWLLAIGLY